MTLECPDRPNCVSSRASDPERRVAPLSYADDAADALSRLAAIVESLPGGEVARADERSLHATFTSRLLRFVDDVDFVVREDGVIDIRSASRVGYYDFGVNEARVESIRALFEGE